MWCLVDHASGSRRLIANGSDPAYSANGRQIAFVRGAAGARGGSSLWIARANGSGATRIYRAPAGSAVATPAWSPSGDEVAFNLIAPGTAGAPLRVEIRTAPTQREPGGFAAPSVLNTPAQNVGGWQNDGSSLSWMPQGDQIAFTMVGGPTGDGVGVGVTTSSGSGAQAGVTGAGQPAWSPDRTALCVTGPGGLSTVPYRSTTLTTVVATTAAGPQVGQCAW